MKIGVNTFGLGPYLKKNEPAVWNGLREAGVTAIEPCIAFHPAEPQTETEKAARERGRFAGVFSASSAAEKIRFWRSMGFEVYSFQLQSHVFSVEAVAEAVPFMKQHGLRYCIFNFMEWSVEKVSRHREGILEAVRMLREEGLEFLVHNHDMEWLPDSGTSVMQWLLDNIPELRFEIDLGWTEYTGHDSIGILKRYPERFALLHFKEIARGGVAWTDKPFCTAPGEGILPLEGLLAAAKEMPLEERAFIIDQDDSVNGDIVGDIAKGVQRISRIYSAL